MAGRPKKCITCITPFASSSVFRLHASYYCDFSAFTPRIEMAFSSTSIVSRVFNISASTSLMSMPVVGIGSSTLSRQHRPSAYHLTWDPP